MCINGYERNEKLLKGTGFVKEGIIRKAMKVMKNLRWSIIRNVKRGM